MLEQVSPDVALTSTRADEESIDVIRDFGIFPNCFFLLRNFNESAVDGSGGVFQVRPARDFIPAKGRDRLLSLRFLTELPAEETAAPSSTHSSSDPPTNAYDFMRRRREMNGDPSMKRWNASIRLGNFASLEGSPLCVGS